MGSLTGSGEPFLGRECVHARRGRPICRRSISIFWQTADLILVHLDSESVHGVGRTGVPAVTYGRNRLWTAAGCAGSTTLNAFHGISNPQWLFLHCHRGWWCHVHQVSGLRYNWLLQYTNREHQRRVFPPRTNAKDQPVGELRDPPALLWPSNHCFYHYNRGLAMDFRPPYCHDWPVLIAQIIFGEETFYDRAFPQADRSIPRADMSDRVLRITDLEQWRSRKQRNSFTQAVSRPFRVLMKPTIFLSTAYYILTFAWVFDINTTLSIFITTPPYNCGIKPIGFFYFKYFYFGLINGDVGFFIESNSIKFISNIKHSVAHIR